MKAGDKVEVQNVWAGGSLIPSKAWFKGYVLVSITGVKAVVKHTEGMYKGISVNYPVCDVRPEMGASAT